MQLILKLGIGICNFIYAFHKLAPMRNRVALISRQSETMKVDMRLLMEELHRQDPTVEIVVHNRMVPAGILGKIRYIFYMVGTEMHAFATSKVVVLEGYCINASILHHRKNLTIIQMWHALGVFKKFGYLALDTDEGRSSTIAKTMHMHENYNYILASSEFCKPIYAAAFRYPESAVEVMPLPRTDILRSASIQASRRAEIFSNYPELNSGKKNLLYAPTFRKDRDIAPYLQQLIDSVDFERYNLIVKLHPIDKTEITDSRIHCCPDLTTMELLSVSDAMITDYSSILFEAAVAGVPVYLYTYDLEEYLSRRGFCIDFREDVPFTKHKTARSLMESIESGDWDAEEQTRFIKKYVALDDSEGSTNAERIARFVLNHRS